MIQDLENSLSRNQALTGATGNINSEDVIDLGAQGENPGIGEAMWVVGQITETFTSGGAATLAAELITSAASNLGSPTVVADLTPAGALALSALTVGTRLFAMRLPANIAQRYLGVRYVVGTANMTAGKVTAQLVRDADFQKYYNSSSGKTAW